MFDEELRECGGKREDCMCCVVVFVCLGFFSIAYFQFDEMGVCGCWPVFLRLAVHCAGTLLLLQMGWSESVFVLLISIHPKSSATLIWVDGMVSGSFVYVLSLVVKRHS